MGEAYNWVVSICLNYLKQTVLPKWIESIWQVWASRSSSFASPFWFTRAAPQKSVNLVMRWERALKRLLQRLIRLTPPQKERQPSVIIHMTGQATLIWTCTDCWRLRFSSFLPLSCISSFGASAVDLPHKINKNYFLARC